MKKMQLGLALAIASFIGIVQAVTLPGPVVSAEWLAANQSEVQILEVRGDVASYTRAPEFEVDKKTGKKFLVEVGGHIQDSTLLDFKKVRADRMIDGKKIKYLIPEKADFEKIIQSVGVNSDKPIILVPVGLDISADAVRFIELEDGAGVFQHDLGVTVGHRVFLGHAFGPYPPPSARINSTLTISARASSAATSWRFRSSASCAVSTAR